LRYKTIIFKLRCTHRSF